MRQISILGKKIAVLTDDGTQFQFEYRTAIPGEIPEGYFHAATLRERGRLDIWYLFPVVVAESLSGYELKRSTPDCHDVLPLAKLAGAPWFRDLLNDIVGA